MLQSPQLNYTDISISSFLPAFFHLFLSLSSFSFSCCVSLSHTHTDRHIISLIGSSLRKMFLSITDWLFVPIKAGQGQQELFPTHWALFLPFLYPFIFLLLHHCLLNQKTLIPPISLFFLLVCLFISLSTIKQHWFHREGLRFKLNQFSGSPAGYWKKIDKILT